MIQLELFPAAAHLTRTEPTANMERRCYPEVAPDLFGGYALMRSRGRIGMTCRVRVELHPTEAAALRALDVRRARKRRRGHA